ncbi:hypothetical protein DFH09DRAFT_1177082 [Mycena vulgaris]|nr:hypothetical protein DFH09DRAFT_1177082 [Mycena vulgaris]
MASIPTPPPQQPPPNPFPNPTLRQSTQQPAFSVGIAAGAEDVKYQAKYKDLKRKVKEIEADNDKLHFKVLQAKRSIQRMKLERAVLYERLQQVPPSPELQDRHPLPPHHGPPNHASDRPASEYIRTHGGTLRQEPRGGPMDSPMAPSHHSSRRGSAGGPEPRPLQFMQHMPPVQQEPHRGRAQIHASPHSHHPSASHERGARSLSRSRAHPPPPIYHPHPQQYPDVQQPQHPLHSPPLSDRGRSHRHDIHELTAAHVRHPNSMPPLSPSSDARANSRVHNHQRMGPGTYINREDFIERGRDRDRERERDWERERERERGRARDGQMRSPPCCAPRAEYPEPHAPSRRREDQGYFPERRVYSRPSSAGSASGSASGAGEPPSRPDSRAQFYGGGDDRSRAFRLRPVAASEEVDFVHEDGRAQSRDRNGGGSAGGYAPEPAARPPADSRKRSRNDMDVDDADEGPPGAMYPSRHSDAEPRGAKRYHQSSDRL